MLHARRFSKKRSTMGSQTGEVRGVARPKALNCAVRAAKCGGKMGGRAVLLRVGDYAHGDIALPLLCLLLLLMVCAVASICLIASVSTLRGKCELKVVQRYQGVRWALYARWYGVSGIQVRCVHIATPLWKRKAKVCRRQSAADSLRCVAECAGEGERPHHFETEVEISLWWPGFRVYHSTCTIVLTFQRSPSVERCSVELPTSTVSDGSLIYRSAGPMSLPRELLPQSCAIARYGPIGGRLGATDPLPPPSRTAIGPNRAVTFGRGFAGELARGPLPPPPSSEADFVVDRVIKMRAEPVAEVRERARSHCLALSIARGLRAAFVRALRALCCRWLATRPPPRRGCTSAADARGCNRVHCTVQMLPAPDFRHVSAGLYGCVAISTTGGVRACERADAQRARTHAHARTPKRTHARTQVYTWGVGARRQRQQPDRTTTVCAINRPRVARVFELIRRMLLVGCAAELAVWCYA
jgi:hypothetical protein